MKQHEALELIRIGVESLTGKAQTIDRECTSNRAAVLLLADALGWGSGAAEFDTAMADGLLNRIETLENEREELDQRIIELNGLLAGARRSWKLTYDKWAEACITRDKLRAECTELRERLEKSELELKDAYHEAEMASDSADLNAAGAGLRREQIEGLSREVGRLRSENTTLRAQLAKEAEARAVAEERVEKIEKMARPSRVDELESELDSLKRETNELYDMLGIVRAERDKFSAGLDRQSAITAQSTKDWQRIVDRMATEAGGYIEQVKVLTRDLDRANTELGVTQGRLDASRERSEKLYAEVKSLHVELAKAEEAARKAKGRGMPDGFEVKQNGWFFEIFENGKLRERFNISLMDREALSAHFIARAELDP